MPSRSSTTWPGGWFGPTRFFGREVEVEQVAQQLRDAQLITLVGAPGSGKTQHGGPERGLAG